jgi:hypothetical protein
MNDLSEGRMNRDIIYSGRRKGRAEIPVTQCQNMVRNSQEPIRRFESDSNETGQVEE